MPPIPAPPPVENLPSPPFSYRMALDGSPVAEFRANSDNDAADVARSHFEEEHCPKEGGRFTIKVEGLDAGVQLTNKGPALRPPGPITEFTVEHEPHPDVADAVRAVRAAAELERLAAEQKQKAREELLAELVAEGHITPQKAEAAKASKESGK